MVSCAPLYLGDTLSLFSSGLQWGHTLPFMSRRRRRSNEWNDVVLPFLMRRLLAGADNEEQEKSDESDGSCGRGSEGVGE